MSSLCSFYFQPLFFCSQWGCIKWLCTASVCVRHSNFPVYLAANVQQGHLSLSFSISQILVFGAAAQTTDHISSVSISKQPLTAARLSLFCIHPESQSSDGNCRPGTLLVPLLILSNPLLTHPSFKIFNNLEKKKKCAHWLYCHKLLSWTKISSKTICVTNPQLVLLSKIHSVSISSINNWVMKGYETKQPVMSANSTIPPNKPHRLLQLVANVWMFRSLLNSSIFFNGSWKCMQHLLRRDLSFGGWLMLTDIMPTSAHLSDCCVPPSGLKEGKNVSRYFSAANLQEGCWNVIPQVKFYFSA